MTWLIAFAGFFRAIALVIEALIRAVIGMMVIGFIGGFIGLVIGAAIGAVIGGLGGYSVNDSCYQSKEWKRSEFVLYLLTAGLGNSSGILYIAGLTNPYILILFALTGTSVPALSMLLYPPLKRRKLIAKYRQSEESLIKP